jgi:hypothetical protein
MSILVYSISVITRSRVQPQICFASQPPYDERPETHAVPIEVMVDALDFCDICIHPYFRRSRNREPVQRRERSFGSVIYCGSTVPPTVNPEAPRPYPHPK